MNIITPLIILGAAVLGASLQAQVWVDGYERQNGTHVDGHYRSSPNDTTRDNYSTRGNTNPYTGQPGTHSPNDGGLQHYRSPDFGYAR